MKLSEFGLIIPTLGTRAEYLHEAVSSAVQANVGEITIVAPDIDTVREFLALDSVSFVKDPMRGLAAAINVGERALGPAVKCFNWLGDDDRLLGGPFKNAVEALGDGIGFVFGNCDYIDHAGVPFMTVKSGTYALQLMRFGPDLVPQPGAVIDRKAFVDVGRLDESLKWAFDLDLFIRLKKEHQPRYLNETVAQFRWHEGSLTAGQRRGSITESATVRRRHLPRCIRPFAWLWEVPGQFLSAVAGRRLNQRASATRSV